MSGVEIALLASSAIGTGFSVGGIIAGANSKSDAAKQNAAIKNMQADELLARQTINEGIMREQGVHMGRQYGSRAAMGEGAGGGGIGTMLAIKQDVEESIINSRRDADFRAQMLRAGADMDLELSSDIMTSGYLGATGTILTGAGSAYKDYKTYVSRSTKDL